MTIPSSVTSIGDKAFYDVLTADVIITAEEADPSVSVDYFANAFSTSTSINYVNSDGRVFYRGRGVE